MVENDRKADKKLIRSTGEKEERSLDSHKHMRAGHRRWRSDGSG